MKKIIRALALGWRQVGTRDDRLVYARAREDDE